MSETVSGHFLRIEDPDGADSDLVAMGGVDRPCRAIRSDSDGNVVVVSHAGDAVTLKFKAGELLPVACDKVVAASTTATGLTIFY